MNRSNSFLNIFRANFKKIVTTLVECSSITSSIFNSSLNNFPKLHDLSENAEEGSIFLISTLVIRFKWNVEVESEMGNFDYEKETFCRESGPQIGRSKRLRGSYL